MKKILIPVDFSKNADDAASYAAMIARQIPCQLHFVHVYTVPMVSDFQIPAHIEALLEANRVKANLDMSAFEADFLRKNQLLEGRVFAHVEYGMVNSCVLSLAKSIDIDLIVMGTKGAGNILERLLGTNAQKIMKKAEIPVLIIPPMAEVHTPKTLLYAADYTENDVDLIVKMKRLFKGIYLQYNVVHVQQPTELNIANQVEMMTHFIDDSFENEEVTVRNIKRNNALEGLETYVRTHKPHILALSKHHKPLFDRWLEPSFTNHFAFATKQPLLVMNK